MQFSDFVTPIINIAALLFVGAQVQLARRALKESAAAQQKERLRLRKQATVEISATTEHYREELRAALPWNDRDPKEMAAFLNAAEGNREKLNPVRRYLNHLENLAVGVKAEVYDLETIDMMWGDRIIAAADSYADYIAWVRNDIKSPAVYEYFDQLVDALRARRKAAS